MARRGPVVEKWSLKALESSLELILGDPGAVSRAERTGGKAPGYRLSPDHFQTVKRMLAPDWAQKILCIIVPNQRTASLSSFHEGLNGVVAFTVIG